MSEFTKFLDGIIGEELAGTHTATLARVERYDPVRSIADVQPLASGQPLITNAPVVCFKGGGFVIRTPLKKGDIVLAVIVEHAVDPVMVSGQPATPDSLRKHDLSDAVVIGGLTMFSQPLPGANGEDLVVATDDLSVKIVITKSGDIKMVSGKNIDIEAKEVSLQAQETISITAPKGISLSATDSSGSGVSIAGKNRSDSW